MEQTAFRTSLDADELAIFVERMLDNLIPDGQVGAYSLQAHVVEALARTEHCFRSIHRKYYNFGGIVEFNHLNSDHLAAFLYFLGNSCWKSTGDTVVPTKLFYLNKILNGLDLYFSVSLPSVFLLVHPVGTVIGNANYGDYLVVYQNCTIGADKGVYPTFGDGVILFSRSSVLGDSRVGANVVFGANSFVVNAKVPANSIVVGQYPEHRVLPNPQTVRNRLFDSAAD